MQFLANENFPLLSVRILRDIGLNIASIMEDSPGIKDPEVLERAVSENRIILTFDRDYGELIFRLSLPKPIGVIYFRYQPRTPEEPAHHLIDLLNEKNLVLEKMFTVLDRNKLRQRPLR
jgi:predicted nuclease of predicted toxin-antitoxin system